jgi:tRNA-splicing ligase RtcB
VRQEVHDGRTLWVHRKGASSAHDGEPGLIPGSMGSPSFHVEGRGCATALCSSSHGAGRRRPRGVAARTITVRDLERSLTGVFFERDLAPRLCDEAPDAYKDIGAVMRAQRELVRVVRRLRPVLAYKGA